MIIKGALLAAAVVFTGCKEEEVPMYSSQEEGINFYIYDMSTSNPYPDKLVAEVNIFDPELLPQEYAQVEIGVQTQGYEKSGDRKFAFKVETISGPEIEVVPEVYTIPDGETMATAVVRFEKSLRSGETAEFRLTFDYDKTDCARGVDQRQEFTVKCGAILTVEAVGIESASKWKSSYGGTDWWGWPDPDGYGYWSSAKAGFIIETLGITDFKSYLPDCWGSNATTATMTLNQALSTLRTALAEYKVKSAADPVAFPPIIDEERNVWINFLPIPA